MADIFFQDDLTSADDLSEGDEALDGDSTVLIQEDGVDRDIIIDDDPIAKPDDLLLPPVDKLEQLADSDLIYNRQSAARKILDTLRDSISNEDDVHSIISVMCRLSDDDEHMVRAEIMEQVPQIALFCREHSSNLESVIRQQLIPISVKLLTDPKNEVRKISQGSLLVLLEQGLIDKSQLNEWICPLVAHLTDSSNTDDQRTEAVTLMSKMAPLVGNETTVRFFLEQFASLCLDSSFLVRKVCSFSFGEFCTVVGRESTETILLPKFLNLCEDEIWGVRKACAEVFMVVSSVVSMQTRKNILPNLFIKLLCDHSRWVKMSAFQALGAFISTFADPNKTGLNCNEDGLWITVQGENSSVTSLPQCDEDNDNANLEQKIGSNHMIETVKLVTKNNLPKYESNSFYSTNIDIDSSFISVPDSINEDFANNSASESVHMKNRFSKSSVTERCETGLSNLNNGSELKVQKCDSSETNISFKENLITKCPAEIGAHDKTLDSSHRTIRHKSERKNNLSNDLSVNSLNHAEHFEDTVRKPRRESMSESALTVTAKYGHLHLHIDNENVFNNFQYWRIPLPEVELDIDIEDGRATSIHIRTKVHDEATNKTCASDLSVKVSPPKEVEQSVPVVNIKTNEKHSEVTKMQVQTACINTITDNASLEFDNASTAGKVNVVNSSFNEASLTLRQGEISELKQSHKKLRSPDVENVLQPLQHQTLSVDSLVSEDFRLSPYDQDIVPPELLEKYISMVEPVQIQIVDSEITRHCAYSLPAVAYTLGRKYWPCLKNIYETLASDMQWKVRKTVAACLHELAVILGAELAARDLLPVFLALLKDLDEVRIGILQHLSQFLRFLRPSERREFLPLIEEFLKMDNERNWRFRHTLAQQMIPTTDLYSPTDVREYLVPVAMWLVRDRVSEVRQAAIRLIAVILRRLSQNTESSFASWLLTELNEKFRQAHKWLWRQTYALLCQQFVLENSLPQEKFVNDVVPNLLSLGWDSVPNVRLVVARCLAQTLLPLDYFPSIQRSHYQLLLQVMYSLQSDVDRDVQFFAHASAEAFSVLPQKLVLPV